MKKRIAILYLLIPMKILFSNGMPDFYLRNSLAALSPDNQKIAFVFDKLNPIKIISISDEKIINSIPVEGDVSALAISPDGKFLAAGFYLSSEPVKAALRIWDIQTGKLLARSEADICLYIEFSDDSSRIRFGTHFNNGWREWDWNKGLFQSIPQRLIDTEHRAEKIDESIAVNKKIGIIVRAGRELNDPLVIEDLETGNLKESITLSEPIPIRGLFFVDSGDKLVVYQSGESSLFTFLDTKSWSITNKNELSGFISQAVPSPDNTLLFLHILPDIGELWSLESMTHLKSFCLKPLEETLYAAVEAGDIREVESLLSEDNIDLNREIGSYVSTALMAASYRGHDELVSILLQAGADVDFRPQIGGLTALWLALGSQPDYDLIATILSYGADVSLSFDRGETYLMRACSNQKVSHEIIELLLRNEAPIHNQTNTGYTALMYAATSINVEKVRLLLEAGANPVIKNSQGNNALDLARNHLQFMEERFGSRNTSFTDQHLREQKQIVTLLERAITD